MQKLEFDLESGLEVEPCRKELEAFMDKFPEAPNCGNFDLPKYGICSDVEIINHDCLKKVAIVGPSFIRFRYDTPAEILPPERPIIPPFKGRPTGILKAKRAAKKRG